jgi:L-amino acid N-acyltransferase YncA
MLLGMLIQLREMTRAEWPSVERIYAQGIEDGEATFEVSTPSWDAFDAGRLPRLRIVAADQEDAIVGWIAASAVSSRPAYRGVVEHSVYIDRAARGNGVGRLLLDAFIAAAEDAGIWTIQSSIFPENVASLRLHETAGFRVVGRRERIAQSGAGPRAGEWRDTILIERRSAEAGTEDKETSQ